ncbi:hypothetical protein D3C85_901840 [compost metagenome]
MSSVHVAEQVSAQHLLRNFHWCNIKFADSEYTRIIYPDIYSRSKIVRGSCQINDLFIIGYICFNR